MLSCKNLFCDFYSKHSCWLHILSFFFKLLLQVDVEGDDARVRFIPNDELGIGSVVEVRIQVIRRPRNRPLVSELCMKICLEPGNHNLTLTIIEFIKRQ